MDKKVSIEITDVKVLNEFLRVLNDYNLNWILGKINVVLDGGQIRLESSNELKLKLPKILASIFGKEYFNEVLLGIDVNTLDEIVLVVIADGELVLNLKTNFEKLLNKIDELIGLFNYKRIKIGIGNGNIASNTLYELLKEKYGDKIKLVDESGTSKFNPYIKVKDEDIRAAVKIALSAML